MSELNYGRMMQKAMQGLMADALGVVAETGLPGEHHFYIIFATHHPGVIVPGWMREKFPREMTIVLQHEFSELAVTRDRFSVKLSFNGRPTTIVVPFDAVVQFADPSAEFGLRFDPVSSDDEDDEDETVGLPERRAADVLAEISRRRTGPRDGAEAEADAAAPGDGEDAAKPSGDVVSLDTFRKK